MIIGIKNNRCTLRKTVYTIKDYIAIKELISLNEHYDSEFEDLLQLIGASTDSVLDESTIIDDKYLFKISFEFKDELSKDEEGVVIAVLYEYLNVDDLNISHLLKNQDGYKTISNLKAKYLK